MRKRISYDLSAAAPGWPGNPKLEISTFTSIKAGDNCNQSVVTFFNHFGSHMDGARHFNDNGLCLGERPFESFFFERPLLLDLPKEAAQAVLVEELEAHGDEIAAADLLMIRTGFSRVRREEPDTYSARGPYVSSKAAKYLMDNFSGNLKAIALDFISLGSPAAPEEGTLAHQYMLGIYHGGRHIPIIEDIILEDIDPKLIRSVAAIPMFIEGLDSLPVTVWAELGEK